MDNVFLNIWLEAIVARHSGTLCRTSLNLYATVNEEIGIQWLSTVAESMEMIAQRVRPLSKRLEIAAQ